MYKIDTKVRYSECGEDGKMKLSSIINQFQDSSCEHSELLGVGTEYLKEKKRAWILNSWQIVVERYPKAHEDIEITTWPTGFKGVFGPSEEEKELYGTEPPLEMEYASRKIKLLEEAKEVDTFFVRKYHIDTNSHMNNCHYVKMAVEVLPEEFVAKQIRVEYKKSAVYGEKIIIKTATEKERTVVELCDEYGEQYAVVEFRGE